MKVLMAFLFSAFFVACSNNKNSALSPSPIAAAAKDPIYDQWIYMDKGSTNVDGAYYTLKLADSGRVELTRYRYFRDNLLPGSTRPMTYQKNIFIGTFKRSGNIFEFFYTITPCNVSYDKVNIEYINGRLAVRDQQGNYSHTMDSYKALPEVLSINNFQEPSICLSKADSKSKRKVASEIKIKSFFDLIQ